MSGRRVVITGAGIWSCIGKNKEEVTKSLYEGRSGIGMDEERITYGYRSPLTGIVERPQLKGLLDRRMRVTMSEEAEYAYMASKEALEEAGITEDYLQQNEIGIIFGNDSSAKSVIETAHRMEEKKDSALLGSGLVFQNLNSTVTMNLSTIFHLRGINFTISAACASGSHAIGIGYNLIKQGLQDVILVGGAQEVNFESMSSFDALNTFSVRTEDPIKASRPFDIDRDGLVPSGGAAALVLEEFDHAVARGATILAEVVGYGFSSNGLAISQPSSEGSKTAIFRALEDADLDPVMIDYINAHATSTQQGDAQEAIAIQEIFGDFNTPVSSTKGQTGHECWMSGASEIVYSLLMMQNNFIAGNVNLETPAPEAISLNLPKNTIIKEIKTVLSNSFGFGGTNSALILKKIQS